LAAAAAAAAASIASSELALHAAARQTHRSGPVERSAVLF